MTIKPSIQFRRATNVNLHQNICAEIGILRADIEYSETVETELLLKLSTSNAFI